MVKDIIYRNQLNITIIAFPILIIFASLILALQPAFSSTAEEEQKKPDYDSYEEYNEIVEPICKERGGTLHYGSGECYFEKGDNSKKKMDFEKELEEKGLYDDYTAEEEASWNQNQDELEEISEEEQEDYQRQMEYQEDKYKQLTEGNISSTIKF
jgi:hypothetical protein